jgi:preprotein translocase subunit YajC
MTEVFGSRVFAFAFQAQGGAAGWLGGPAFLIVIFAIFYFLLILPQQRRQKKWQKMLSELKTGDRVVTSGGIRGTVIALRDDLVHIRVAPDNLKLEVAKNAIASVTAPEGEAVTK